MLWNSRQVIYRNINVRGDGLISLNFITMPSFLLYKHIKPAVIQVPYCKIVPRRCPSLELFCIFYLTVKNIIKFFFILTVINHCTCSRTPLIVFTPINSKFQSCIIQKTYSRCFIKYIFLPM